MAFTPEMEADAGEAAPDAETAAADGPVDATGTPPETAPGATEGEPNA
jgi:hypothetical protein